MAYEYSWLPGTLVTEEIVEQLSRLYSEHYGTWSTNSPVNPGQKIRLSAKRIRDLLTPRDARLAWASSGEHLVGYAVALQVKVADYGVVSWVTQLVVHEDHRDRDVGKNLLFAIWGFTDHFAWGLLTANPYAVRALEKATRRRSRPERILRNARKLINVAIEHVPYVNDSTKVQVTKMHSRIDTRFLVDHSRLSDMLQAATRRDLPWLLGSLEEGWEWFAFTFNDQEEIGLAADEIETMLKTSDQVTQRAYSRMTLDEQHAWAQHGLTEARQIVDYCELSRMASVLDVGCGTGRHCLALAEMGINVLGIDYVERLITSAERERTHRNIANA